MVSPACHIFWLIPRIDFIKTERELPPLLSFHKITGFHLPFIMSCINSNGHIYSFLIFILTDSNHRQRFYLFIKKTAYICGFQNCTRQESNLRPTTSEAVTLSTELLMQSSILNVRVIYYNNSKSFAIIFLKF